MHSFLRAICIGMNLMLWEHLWVRLSGAQFLHIICGIQTSKLLFSRRNSCFVGQVLKKSLNIGWQKDMHVIYPEKKTKSPNDTSWDDLCILMFKETSSFFIREMVEQWMKHVFIQRKSAWRIMK